MNGEVKTINPPYHPHPDLDLDYEAMAKLPESRQDTELWTLVRKVSPKTPQMEQVLKKAHLRSATRICPRHGVVDVLSRNYTPKRITGVESLSCGHTLLIFRLVGGLKSTASDPRLPKSYIHQGWLFSFKETIRPVAR